MWNSARAYHCIDYTKKLLSLTYQAYQMKVLVTQLCFTLCDPMDCRLPGSSVHGLL